MQFRRKNNLLINKSNVKSWNQQTQITICNLRNAGKKISWWSRDRHSQTDRSFCLRDSIYSL